MGNIYSGSNTGKAGLEITAENGNPDVYGVSKIIVSNGSLRDDGNGTVTLTTSGGGGGAWIVKDNANTEGDIDSGDTLSILGGTAITSALTNEGTTTPSLTLNLDNTAVTPGTYGQAEVGATPEKIPRFEVDAQGRLVFATQFDKTPASFSIIANSGLQAVSDGGFLFAQGATNEITTSISGSPNPTLSIALVDTGVTAGDYTDANISVDATGRISAASSLGNILRTSTETIGLTTSDANKTFFSVNGDTTFNLPSLTAGLKFVITRETASGTLTVNATGGATINGGASFTMPATAYTAITIVCDGFVWIAY